LIYRLTGIRLSPQKRTLLANRVRRRLRATGLADFEAYYQHLQSIEPSHPEWDAFLQEITTHETYLFRDDAHWNWLLNQFLPSAMARTGLAQSPRPLRFWSAACSTGDEAFSIAACVAHTGLNADTRTDVSILGTDIGIDAVRQAREATFSARAMRMVPPAMRDRWFQKLTGERWQARPTLRQWTEFRQHNLLEPLAAEPFDVVFLKNVLIYFDEASKRKVLQQVRQRLRPGGLLLAGAAEGVSDLIRDFERLQPWLYRWPGTTNPSTRSGAF
jgi:chemotaxis protein methyltransferase CheR